MRSKKGSYTKTPHEYILMCTLQRYNLFYKFTLLLLIILVVSDFKKYTFLMEYFNILSAIFTVFYLVNSSTLIHYI